MIGPNAPATLPVPLLWNAKSTMAMTMAMNTIDSFDRCAKPGMSTAPSTALNMLIAGVITPSPMRSEMPMKDKSETKRTLLLDFSAETRISRKTIVPPSPLLLRFMAIHEYWTVTRATRVQMISDSTPITLS